MTSWSRRVSSAAHRQALRDVAAAAEAGSTVSPALSDDDIVGQGSGAPRGLSGEQVRSILTDTLVETPDMVAIFASIGREAMWANDAFVTLITLREADQIWLIDLMDEWSRGHYEVKVLPALVKFGRWRGRLTFVADDGPVPVSAALVAHRTHDGEISCVSLVARDLTELRTAFEHVEASTTRLAALVENAADLIVVVASDGTIEYLSPAVTRVLGHAEGELDGVSVFELVHPDDVPADLLGLARPDDQGIGIPVELRLRTNEGSWRHFEVVVTDLSDNPAIGGIVLNARDVTDRIEAARAQANRAFTDSLTGLPNRVRLLDRLASALAGPDGETVITLVCDIDQFKRLNTVIGAAGGDRLLQEVAARLRSSAGDDPVLARLGGDGFAVVLGGIELTGAIELADQIREAVSAPIELDGRVIDLSLSVGLAEAIAGDGPELLVHRAEQAMHRAKQDGGDQVVVYDTELAAVTDRRETVKQLLDEALDHDHIRVHFQPMFDIKTERIVGAEALLRVEDGGALLSAAEFVEAAESGGLISRLGMQVLQITCDQLAAWSDRGTGARPHELSVNVSPRQLADPDFAAQVREVLESSGVEPARLCLEITESMLIGAQPAVDVGLDYLKALGVRIGLDDFGTGHSSLGYLKRFPLDFVKIDQSLIGGLGVDEQDTAIVRATIDLAHNLGLLVVAVGVETDAQLEALAILGCDRAQGYLFAPPLPAAQLVTWLEQSPGRPQRGDDPASAG